MEAAGLRLRALGHHRHYCGGGFKRGWLEAARGERRRRAGGASCSPALCSLAASGNGNGAAVGPVGSGAEVACARRMLHVVLVSPLPLGFKLDDTKLKRAGLDYWPYVVVKIHDSWDDFRDYFIKQEGEKRLLAFTKRGTSIHSDFSYKPGDWLVFGSETKGLPQEAHEDCCREGLGGGTIRIPMVETYVRCLNLSVSVGIAVYEAARQLNYEQLQYQPELPEAQELFPAEDIYA
ncbi:tRNA (cytidine(34)-2'-O)-methyltransferase-like isoform X2 [Panicum virgatum]|uniref:tRNA (cytidine(34)-2'-O)-methyltransferase-like isoform X2 n=1 Tax=Panicum virgatum TaxID=38727 RepID=UPI0019D59977|nr:tRNA (cytidine(34)-2'-O)-methyltransferase-like isoform X2 [Panicum virgatum]